MTTRSTVPRSVQRQMVSMYQEGLSTRQIGERLYWSKGAVLNVLRARRVPLRARGGAHPNPTLRRFNGRDARVIVQLYRDGLSTREIGQRFGVPDTTILRTLRREGEPTRSGSAAQTLGRYAQLSTRGADALTPRQRKTLGILETLGPRTTPQVARLIGLPTTATRHVLMALETFGLVTHHGPKPYTWKRTTLPLRDVLERALDPDAGGKILGDTPLPIGPLIAWVDELIAREQRKAVFAGARNKHGDGSMPTVDTVAARLGVPARVISRWRNEARTIGLLTADRILTRADGPHVSDLWPHLAAECEEIAA